ncbi:MAG: radical SAM protein [Candidatus Marinimicrobia bacterium]|nr:radical SAM protein [Candidatus Neomarinimicrobiota bacterium]
MSIIRKIFISASSQNDGLTRRILSDLPNLTPEILDDDDDLSGRDDLSDAKQVLFLTHSKGDVVKDCPGTSKDYLCCRYRVINQTQNCPLNCTYCILQFYLNFPATVIFTNVDEILQEAATKIQRHPKRLFRIGTGELGDSLALSGSRYFAECAVEFFAGLPNVVFELKSKTTQTDSILPLKHGGKTILSWSVNPQEIVKREESAADRLSDRLAAAQKAQDAGFLVGFHFDPILSLPNVNRLYLKLCDAIYNTVDPARIAWVSLGSLRFPPSMKDAMAERYPKSAIPYGEMIRGIDRKLRYVRPLRVSMYRPIYERLMRVPNPPFVYFCMESPTVWMDATGFSPENNNHLDFLFADNLHRRFPDRFPIKPEREEYDHDCTL